jgi:hypothetical protein
VYSSPFFFCIVKRLNFLLHAKGESESLLSFFFYYH